ncbi:hypothetical protein [Nitratireductor soli]|uniref:hypothetical protein n=1 Tax=Nitratireductor soli TaxID=1670619 RepID=UPI000A5253D8|nr:hypothetical protein [Nitratireductor soli]
MKACCEPALEIVQLELMLEMSDLVALGFETTLLNALDKLDGAVLFNRRLDGDDVYQRAAAVTVGPDRDVALVFLDHSGTSTHTEAAAASQRPVAREALEAARETGTG